MSEQYELIEIPLGTLTTAEIWHDLTVTGIDAWLDAWACFAVLRDLEALFGVVARYKAWQWPPPGFEDARLWR